MVAQSEKIHLPFGYQTKVPYQANFWNIARLPRTYADAYGGEWSSSNQHALHRFRARQTGKERGLKTYPRHIQDITGCHHCVP